MNSQPIENARDSDLRASRQALRRAARRAYALAAQTGTAIIVSHNGVIERIEPPSNTQAHKLQEPSAPYGNNGNKK